MLETKEFLQTVINGIRDEIIVIDRAYRIKEINESGAKRLGKPKHEIVGEYCYRVLHGRDKPCDIPDHPCPVEDTLRTGEPGVLYTHFEGREVRCYRIMACPVLDDLGVGTQLIVTGRDTAKSKKSSGQVYDKQTLSSDGQLAAAAAHEFNNPLAVILSFADLLLEKMEPGSQSYEILKTIERQALSCKRVVECLSNLTVYRKTTGKSTDVNVNLEKMVCVIENILVTRNVTLDKNFAEGLPRARGDSEYLRQVFMNLITNAIAAMDKGGHLSIATRLNAPADRVEIVFKDTGHGIKREYRDKIVDPGFTTRKAGGDVGLGLSVSYGIVSKYGGDITFETVAEEEDRESKGTTFTVSLPVAHDQT
ncbi:MAG: PAS domain-containing protein [Deltaproteobacteria bacterium]|nr:PAS domain-containing protein [Deltaproteobacteria bacterium]